MAGPPPSRYPLRPFLYREVRQDMQVGFIGTGNMGAAYGVSAVQCRPLSGRLRP